MYVHRVGLKQSQIHFDLPMSADSKDWLASGTEPGSGGENIILTSPPRREAKSEF